MVETLEQSAAGGGLVIGDGVGGTVATLSGQEAFALVAGFGAAGGLLVGAMAGRYATGVMNRANWRHAVVAFTLALSFLVGSVLGVLTGWMLDSSMAIAGGAGAVGGGVFGVLLTAILLRTGSTR
ncbi:hypothetical protein HTSR_1236 [Halodesulfurarchaeum formicicum]|uniref:Major facilitator superfamily (MFS) profile domain-containing protein n=1 Tax=Halodesulfurarchaeum formicicum TaxID=1873524 RepID=A0A1D8S4Y9_9EURY|nr:hypothetical protein [Halodesulfurarchaeum formicicum]AOW80414.1 hypothetical protein HTSR_1236 [Halodesulfurarchaeum formicicum]